MKYILPILIVVGVIGGYMLYKKMQNMGKPPASIASSAVSSPSVIAPAPASKEERKRNDAAYDIYAEHFMSWNGNQHALKTVEGGWYQVGEMSDKGYVTAVSDRRARIAQPDGRTGWIVASQDAARPAPATTPSPLPKPSPTVIVAIDATVPGASVPGASVPGASVPGASPTPSSTVSPIGIIHGNSILALPPKP